MGKIRKWNFPAYKTLLFFIFLTAVNSTLLFLFVDLRPKVDENFFFSSEDPRFQQEKQISRLFERKDTQLIICAEGDITAKGYERNVKNLSSELIGCKGVITVKSISHGPDNIRDAQSGPLWRRLLIGENLSSTNIIVIIEGAYSEELLGAIEKIVARYNAEGFRLRISGIPYIVRLIQQNLSRDLKRFNLYVFIIFGLIVALIFRSPAILLGTIITCVNACAITLLISKAFHIPIGLLTANLTTIVFVLTLSHIIFLTFNWKYLYAKNPSSSCVAEAVRMTFSSSFWSMFTTLLGFLSLLGVSAKPLRELGVAGVIGSLVTIIACYSIYLPFLRLARPRLTGNDFLMVQEERLYVFLSRKKIFLALCVALLCLCAPFFIAKIKTDPSLLSYFRKESEIANGLRHIDQNGGSSPLIIVVKTRSGEKLNTPLAYTQLWNLQEALEKEEEVGTVISLPVLLAEAKQAPLAFFLSWEWLLDILEKPMFDQVAKSFITQDRTRALFLLRMKEQGREKSRLDIIDELKGIVRESGFVPELTGGVYALQGHLSRLVASSLIFGLGQLIVIFFFISWIIARSFKIAIAITISVSCIPLGILGIVGFFRIPLDVISAPASNVAIGMGIDSMIHMIKHYRRQGRVGSEKSRWLSAEKALWQPIMTSCILVGAGFGIFLFSQFPPTQRFGLAIVCGMALSCITSLFIMPRIAQRAAM